MQLGCRKDFPNLYSGRHNWRSPPLDFKQLPLNDRPSRQIPRVRVPSSRHSFQNTQADFRHKGCEGVCFLCLDGSHESSLLLKFVDRLSRPGPALWLRFVHPLGQARSLHSLASALDQENRFCRATDGTTRLVQGRDRPRELREPTWRKEPVD